MDRRSSHAAIRPRQHRRGATLIEVLMALLIFSIGIVSVFTLFPISILQSIRASQLTNARIQFDNADQLLKTRPELLLGARYWEPNTAYSNGDLIVPQPVAGSSFPPNNLYYTAGGNGVSGDTEPTWGGASVTGTGSTPITWNRDTSTNRSRFVVDPLGRALVDTAPTRFGNDGTDGSPGVDRIDVASDIGVSQAALNQMFSLPDSWSAAIEAVPTSSGVSTITFAPEVDLSTITGADRVVITSEDGHKSVIRTLSSAPTGNSLNLATPLPTELDDETKISTVRVEVYNRRYTWMISVNRETTGETAAQCAIFFNRRYSFADEQAYLYTIDPANNPPGPAVDRTVVKVDWTGPEPLIRDNNFIFDTISCRWYQVVNATVSGNSAILILDQDIAGTHDGGDPAGSAFPSGGLIFMPGVIHVYEL